MRSGSAIPAIDPLGSRPERMEEGKAWEPTRKTGLWNDVSGRAESIYELLQPLFF